MIQCKPPMTCWCNNLSFARKQPVRIKSPLIQIQYLREVPGFRSAGHIYHCKSKLVVLTTERLPWLQTNWRDCNYERFALVLKTNCIRQPKGRLPSSSYNHNTCTDNPQNICEGVITNALQSCIKELSCS